MAPRTIASVMEALSIKPDTKDKGDSKILHLPEEILLEILKNVLNSSPLDPASGVYPSTTILKSLSQTCHTLRDFVFTELFKHTRIRLNVYKNVVVPDESVLRFRDFVRKNQLGKAITSITQIVTVHSKMPSCIDWAQACVRSRKHSASNEDVDLGRVFNVLLTTAIPKIFLIQIFTTNSPDFVCQLMLEPTRVSTFNLTPKLPLSVHEPAFQQIQADQISILKSRMLSAQASGAEKQKITSDRTEINILMTRTWDQVTLTQPLPRRVTEEYEYFFLDNPSLLFKPSGGSDRYNFRFYAAPRCHACVRSFVWKLPHVQTPRRREWIPVMNGTFLPHAEEVTVEMVRENFLPHPLRCLDIPPDLQSMFPSYKDLLRHKHFLEHANYLVQLRLLRMVKIENNVKLHTLRLADHWLPGLGKALCERVEGFFNRRKSWEQVSPGYWRKNISLLKSQE